MDKNALLIVNPISGTRAKRDLPQTVVSRLGEWGWSTEIALTKGPGDATQLASAAAASGEYAVVIAAGGDGTVNETARGLIDTDTPLAIIPCGSGNGLARHLNIPLDTGMALDIINSGTLIKADYATANSKPFFCTCGVGFDAAVSERFAAKNRRGLITYLQTAFEIVVRYSPTTYTIEANGLTLTHEAFLVAVCNASQYGNNAFIAPGASIVDGLLDVIVLHAGNPFETMKFGLEVMSGTLNRNAQVDIVRTSSLSITRNTDGPAHLDGEPVDNLGRRLEIACHPGCLNMIVPSSIPQFKPLVTPLTAFVRDMRLTFRHLLKI